MAGVRSASGYQLTVAATHPYIHGTPDITAMSVKASQNQAGQTISDDN